MTKRLLTVLAFATVISAVASLLLYRVIVTQMASTAKAPETHLLVAAHNLQTGDLIKDSDIKVADWSGPVPQGAMSRPEDAAGRGVIEPILADEPLVDSRIAPRGAGAGLAAIIPPGMRAVAVRVNDVVGVAGFVTPGMHVDVLIAGNPPGGNPAGTLTKTLLQNIEVLSAGQNLQKDAEGKPISVPVVNMLVTPEQAEILSLASNETRIQLILRNPTDTAVTKTPGTAIAYLFYGNPPPVAPRAPAPVKAKAVAPPPPPPPPPPKQPLVIEVIHGTKKAEATFLEKTENKPEGKPE